jgi:hypothetical protein
VGAALAVYTIVPFRRAGARRHRQDRERDMTSPDESVTLTTAANGLAWIVTSSRRRHRDLGLLLVFRYDFRRSGPYVPGVAGEAVYPDYVRGDLCIHAGRDDWMGYDLLATDAASDRFLREFHAKHCVGTEPPNR